jgi:hypothetical protein
MVRRDVIRAHLQLDADQIQTPEVVHTVQEVPFLRVSLLTTGDIEKG